MNFNIIMKDEVYDEIHTLMNNIKVLNAGEEIGAWLTGEWTHTETESTLKLDKFVIPEQEVSKTEVDISPESMIDTIKELGSEGSNRIKAHWHIHPFGKGKTNWSSIDESKIGDFMSPEKQREIFVFLLSSEDQLKARVEVRIKGKLSFKQEEFVFSETYDHLPVVKESSQGQPKYLEQLKERISNKVKKKVYNFTKYNKVNNEKETYKDLYEVIKGQNNTLIVKIDNNPFEEFSFINYLEGELTITKELQNYDDSYEDMNNNKVVYIFKLKSPEQVKNYAESFEEELLFLQEDYLAIVKSEEVMDEMKDYNSSYGLL